MDRSACGSALTAGGDGGGDLLLLCRGGAALWIGGFVAVGAAAFAVDAGMAERRDWWLSLERRRCCS